MARTIWEGTGIYTGIRKRLFNHTSLLRIEEGNDKILAQFNSMQHPESHGWHEFDRLDFVNLRTLNGVHPNDTNGKA